MSLSRRKCWYSNNRTACVRHICRKTTVLSCHRCLINTNEQRLNKDWSFEHQMSLSKRKCWYSNNRRACIRQLCRKTTVLSCQRCLINTNEQHLNTDWSFEHQMSPRRRKCWYSDNRTACIRHIFRKTTVFSCHRCLINTNEQRLNKDWSFEHQMSLRGNVGIPTIEEHVLDTMQENNCLKLPKMSN